jgi:membrane-bound ClpP family serine protease
VNTLVGRVGWVVIPTRGAAGAGEVLLNVGGSQMSAVAWSAEPLGKGQSVLVIDTLGPRIVTVEPWKDFGVVPEDE